MDDNPDTPQAVAAINTLIEFINQLHSGRNIKTLQITGQICTVL